MKPTRRRAVAAPVELTLEVPRRCSTICSFGGARLSGEVGADGDRAPAIRQKAVLGHVEVEARLDGSTLWHGPAAWSSPVALEATCPERPLPGAPARASARLRLTGYQLCARRGVPVRTAASGGMDGAQKTLGGHLNQLSWSGSAAQSHERGASVLSTEPHFAASPVACDTSCHKLHYRSSAVGAEDC